MTDSPSILATTGPSSSSMAFSNSQPRDARVSPPGQDFEQHLAQARSEEKRSAEQAQEARLQSRHQRAQPTNDESARALEDDRAAKAGSSTDSSADATTDETSRDLAGATASHEAEPRHPSDDTSDLNGAIQHMQALQEMTNQARSSSGSATPDALAGANGQQIQASLPRSDWFISLRSGKVGDVKSEAGKASGTPTTSPPTDTPALSSRTSTDAVSRALTALTPASLTQGEAGPFTALPGEGGVATGSPSHQVALFSGMLGDASSASGGHSLAGMPLAAPGVTPQGMLQGTLHGVPPSVGSQAWQQSLSDQVVRMQLSRTPQAELTLNPADLGRLSIHLSLGEQTTSAHFVAAHQQVRAAVEASLADLRQALDAQGHALSEVTISGEDDSAAQFHWGDGQQGGRDDGHGERQSGEHAPLWASRTGGAASSDTHDRQASSLGDPALASRQSSDLTLAALSSGREWQA